MAEWVIYTGILHKTSFIELVFFSGVKSRGGDDFDTQIHNFRLTDVKGNVIKDVIAG